MLTVGLHCEARLNRAMTRLAAQLNLYLNHFPKHEKYALCQAIRQELYAAYGLIVECQKRYHKKTSLSQLDICHERLRWFCHLANELGYFNAKHGSKTCIDGARRYLCVSEMIDEVGRMIGGWRRSLARDGA